MYYLRRRTLVSVSLPASWSSDCRKRQQGEAGARAGMVRPDLVIVSDEDSEGVRALQHLGCGHRGLQVTVSHGMFTPSLNIMDHHRKGENYLAMIGILGEVVMNYLCH